MDSSDTLAPRLAGGDAHVDTRRTLAPPTGSHGAHHAVPARTHTHARGVETIWQLLHRSAFRLRLLGPWGTASGGEVVVDRGEVFAKIKDGAAHTSGDGYGYEEDCDWGDEESTLHCEL